MKNTSAVKIQPSVQQSDTKAVQQEYQAGHPEAEREDLSVFFGIGVTINIIILVSFVIWAVKQWKMRNALKK